jgi:hypothetical protein
MISRQTHEAAKECAADNSDDHEDNYGLFPIIHASLLEHSSGFGKYNNANLLFFRPYAISRRARFGRVGRRQCTEYSTFCGCVFPKRHRFSFAIR